MVDATPAIWVDGDPAAALPLPDRGLDFGDGLFETVLLRCGEPVLLDYHMDRLQTGLDALSFPDCLRRAKAQLLKASSASSALDRAVLRLSITRGSGPRGYASPENVTARTVITVTPLPQHTDDQALAISVDWCQMSWSLQPLLAGIKHLNRLEQVLAANEARTLGVDDVVMRDASGLVCSLSSANLFLRQGERLLTPRLHCAGIAGTRRRLIIDRLAPALGLPVDVVDIRPEQLEQADELFCCNAIRGLQPISRLGRQHWQEHPACSALHDQYQQAIAP